MTTPKVVQRFSTDQTAIFDRIILAVQVREHREHERRNGCRQKEKQLPPAIGGVEDSKGRISFRFTDRARHWRTRRPEWCRRFRKERVNQIGRSCSAPSRLRRSWATAAAGAETDV